MELRPGKFREVTWDEVRGEVQKLAPDLFDAIEAMSPDKSYKLYEATYPYGASLFKDNKFVIPHGNEWETINSTKLDKEVTAQLAYQIDYGIPLGLVLEGELQLSFRESEKNKTLLPYFLFKTGDVFAIRAALDYPIKYQAAYYWNMHSGARTTCMLASLADRRKFKNVQKEFGSKILMPEEQGEHWDFFRSLANSNDFSRKWNARVLFFAKKWVDTLKQHKELHYALLNRFFVSSHHERNASTLNKIWDDFILTINSKKIDRHIILMARYIFDSAIGKSLSFKIADLEGQAGPFAEIAKIVSDIYELEKYAPIIMIPHSLDGNYQQETYVSIRYSGTNTESISPGKNNFLMSEYQEIAYVVNKFISSMKSEVVQQIPAYNMTAYDYTFYSADKNSYDFLPSSKIFSNNSELNYWTGFCGREVHTKNPFLRACIRINKNSKQDFLIK